MGQGRRLRHTSIALATAAVVTLVACGPPFPTTPSPAPAPTAPAPVESPTTTTTISVPSTVLPTTEALACPGGSDVTAASGTVPMQVDDPLQGVELFEATVAAADDAVAEPVAGSSAGPEPQPTVVITSVVDGAPVVESAPVDESLAAAADADAAGEVVAVEALSSVSALEEPGSLEGADAVSGLLASNDTFRANLWAFDALEFERLWQCATGRGVSVAVLDSGVLGSHPDLVARVTPGWTKLTTGPGAAGGGNVDPHGHGTHVAGTIGAIAGNGHGVTGVAPDVEIVPVRVLGADGNGTNLNVAAGITWAVDHGVDVINLSLGSADASSAVLNALVHAENNGVLVVAAGGNDGEDGSPTMYPAAYDETVAVAAIDSTLAVAAYSNRGDYVDVAAPGSGILSTFNTGGYAWSNGTSMAAPHVAGLAAVLLSAEPQLSATELRARILDSVDDAGAPGVDDEYGHGIINPVRALTGDG